VGDERDEFRPEPLDGAAMLLLLLEASEPTTDYHEDDDEGGYQVERLGDEHVLGLVEQVMEVGGDEARASGVAGAEVDALDQGARAIDEEDDQEGGEQRVYPLETKVLSQIEDDDGEPTDDQRPIDDRGEVSHIAIKTQVGHANILALVAPPRQEDFSPSGGR